MNCYKRLVLKQGNHNNKQVRDIGSKYVNVEISAQEAVYIVLQLPMRKASRQIIFINTSPPDERVELLKPMDDIKDLDDDCEEIHTSGLIKRYCRHPAKLEHLTTADWAAWYANGEKPYVKKTNEVDADGLPLETIIGDNQKDDKFCKATSSRTKKRNKAKIISVWFNKESVTPWRNEEKDLIGNCSYQEHYMLLTNAIKEQKEYAVCNEDFSK